MPVDLLDLGSRGDLPPVPFLVGGLEATADGLLLLDAEGRVRYHNRRLAEILDVPNELLEEVTDDATEAVRRIFLHPDRFLELVERERIEPELETTCELRLTDNRVVQRHSRPLRVADEVVGRVTSLRDVTELEETRRDLEHAERRYRTLFEVTPLALVVSRPSGEIVTVNDRLETLLGHAADEVVDRDARELDVWVDLDDRQQILEELEQEGVVRDYSSTIRTATGEELEVELSVDQVRLDDEPYLTWAIRDVTIRNRYQRELEQQALYDDLTGLPNRALLFDRLQHARDVAFRDDQPLAVLFVDLDDFKAVNDRYGQAAGDQVLAEAAARMSTALRGRDTLARIGGDEFVAILEDTAEAGARRAAGRIVRAVVGLPFEVAGEELTISASVGLALRSEDLDGRESLLRAADAALERAKYGAGDGGPVHLFGPGDETRQFRLQKRGRLREALDNDEFELYYQPVVDLQQAERIVGVEALIRWNHPERGLVPPEEFIPLAEETELISDLDRWSLRHAAEQKVRWRKESLLADLGDPFSVAVNVSAPLYQSPNFGSEVQAVLRETGLSASALQLEITERLSVSNMGTWGRLRREGIRLAIDDFGTGYSSLRYLRDLDADVLKVDQYFTQDLTDEADRTSVILKAVVSVGRQMDIELIAEGVETGAQRRHLADLGYRYAQGYLFARPMPADDFERLLEDGGVRTDAPTGR